MYLILWHNLRLIITLFPGIILFIMNRVPIMRRISEMDKYVICLISVVILNIYNKIDNIDILASIFICSLFTFILEYLFNEWKKLDFNKCKYVISQIKRPVYVMIIFPCFEELIYRYFLYFNVTETSNNIYLYFILSVSTFVFVHFFNQKMKCFFKIPFAIIECLIFIAFHNVLICIIIHMNFNILVYAYNTSKYNRGRIV